MTLPTTVHGSIAIGATDVWPRVHSHHGDDRHSLALTPDTEPMSIYVRGTYSELLDLAAKIVASVPVTELPGHVTGTPAERPHSTPSAWESDCGFVDEETGSPICVDCSATMMHDRGPYWWCNRSDCPAYRHTILFSDGTRSHVGMMR